MKWLKNDWFLCKTTKLGKVFLQIMIICLGFSFIGCKNDSVNEPSNEDSGGDVRSGSPNILFIVTDDLGISDLGCYGSDYYLTPHLDELADQGMRFTEAYAGCTVCSPTRASIFTGKYSHRVHLTDALPWDRLRENPKMVPPNHLKELPSDLPTFAKALRSADYKTALLGKWHLGNEYEFYQLNGHDAYGFDESVYIPGPEQKKDKGVEKLTKLTTDFLEDNKERPFMLCLMHYTPHIELACPPEYEAIYDGVPVGKFQKNKKYAGMMSHLDYSTKTILDKLEALGLDQNTIVVFTSDNGGFVGVTSNEPYSRGKGKLYEGGIRVPLIVRWPGQIKENSVCDVPVHSNDYFPTFLAMAGLSPMPGMNFDGVSMLPLLNGENLEPRALYWHFPHDHGDPASAVRNGDWKLIHHIPSDIYELFNLKNDPSEKNDLVKAHPEMVASLKKMLEDHLQESSAQRMRPNPEWDSSRPEGQLRSYGVFYPPAGGEHRIILDPYPSWWFE